MKTLLIDAGNTRVKWTVASAGRLAPVRAAPWTDTGPFSNWLDRAGDFERVVACSVAGPKAERTLRRLLRAAGTPTERNSVAVDCAMAGTATVHHKTKNLTSTELTVARAASNC